jgi:hypothetical protein
MWPPTAGLKNKTNQHEADTSRAVAYREFGFISRDIDPFKPTEILGISVESAVSLAIKFMFLPLFLLLK